MNVSRAYNEVYTAAEFARLFKCDRSTVYEQCRSGVLPHIRLGKIVRIPGWFVKSKLEPPADAAT